MWWSVLVLSCVSAITIPSDLLQEALQEGYKQAQLVRDAELILGFQLRSGHDLDSTSNQLFNFRRPEFHAKTSSACLGMSLLEVSKYLIKRLPGTTVEGVQRLQQQKLQSSTCRQLLRQAGGNCSSVRVGQVAICSGTQAYRSLDGSCNNLRRSDWGSSARAFSRYLRPAYEDGLDEPRGSGRPTSTSLPSPRKVSTVMSGGTGNRVRPQLAITSLVMQFGQFVDHDLTHTPESAVRGSGNTLLPFGCCERGVPPSPADQQRVPDCRPIDLTGDPFFAQQGRSCMRFVRSLVADNGCRLGPRQQLNQVTSFLDGSVLYGTSQFLSNHLRDRQSRGQLRHSVPPQGGGSPRGCPRAQCSSLLPEQRCHAQTTQKCFISGDGRANEQPGLTSLHILFMRIHNSIATGLAAVNPNWNSDTVFQETRRVVGALLQQVTYRELLPVVLGSAPMDHFSLWLQPKGYFTGYNASIDPTTPNVFATAAFRFGHSLVDDVLLQRGFSNVTLLNSFNQPNILKQHGTKPSQFLQSSTHATSQVSDEYMVPTITNNLFGTTQFPVGFDLYALNIMRGRDHGLASYNSWRAACGLPRASSWSKLASFTSNEAMNKFRSLYKSVEDLDLFPAALAEPPLGNGILGPTFACLIGQHFHDLKFGDRFWHENLHQPKPFTNEQLSELRSVWFASLLCHHADIDVMQPSPFLAPDNTRNILENCQSYKKLDLRAWKDGFGTVGPQPVKSPNATDLPQIVTLTTKPPTPVTQTSRPTVTNRPIPVTKPPSVRPPFTFRPPVRPPITSRPQVRPPVTSRPQVRPPITSRPQVRPPITSRPQVQPPITGRPSVKPSITARPPVWPPITPGSPSVKPPVGFVTSRPDPNRPQVHPTVSQATSRPPPWVTSKRPPAYITPARPTAPPFVGYPVVPFGRVCRASGLWSRLLGMDRWCQDNCFHPGASHCPASHCVCL